MSIKEKKILFFVGSNCGGAERMTIQISKMLLELNNSVAFYIIGDNSGSIVNFLPPNVERHFLKKSNGLRLLSEFFRVVNREKPDVIFSSLFSFNTKLCLLSLFFPKTSIIIRSDNYLYTLSGFQKIVSFLTYRLANKIIVQTEEMKEEFISKLKVSESKVLMLSNPVDTEEINKKTHNVINPFVDKGPNYVFVGRINKVKGIDILLNSFSLVLKESPESNLFLVGDITGAAETSYLEFLDLANSLGIANRVQFLGFNSNPYGYMKFADCLVLPSRNEGLPNVILEALYLKTPVAATRCIPVISRLIQNDVDGYLSNVEDVDGFAIAMLKAVKINEVNFTYRAATKEQFVELF